MNVTTATARVNTATAVREAFSGCDRADAANAALIAGLSIYASSRVAWDAVKNAADMGPIREVAPTDHAARSTANLLAAAADTTLGLVSNAACGLWVVTYDGHAGIVESTDNGSDTLRMVRWSTRRGCSYDFDVKDAVAFYEHQKDAHEVAGRILIGAL